MEVIYRSRGRGKTTDLIKIAAEGFYYMVCANMKRVQWTANLARELGLDIPFPVTFDEFIRKEYYGKGIKGFVIDDADQLLQYMSSVPVFAVALNDSSKEES